MSAIAWLRQSESARVAPVSILVGRCPMVRTLIIAVCFCIPALGQTRGRPVDTSICSVAAHPSKFSHKNVRIRAMALSGMEASFLMDRKDGEWNKDCGQINLDFSSAGSDESTRRFLQLFAEQISQPKCNQDEELLQGMAHILDPNVPAPTPCFNFICFHCPRYNIVATFTGKLRYSATERGHARFGHLGMFDLQLDVVTVANLEVADTLAPSKR